jgi:hypothetical protein
VRQPRKSRPPKPASSRRVLRQPDGQLAVFSDLIGAFIGVNLSVDEARELVGSVPPGLRYRFQTWTEALRATRKSISEREYDLFVRELRLGERPRHWHNQQGEVAP